MSIDLTAAPTHDPLRIYRYRDSLYAVDLITAALSIDFFTWLAAHPSSLASICEQLRIQRAACGCDAHVCCTANGWVKNDGGVLHASDDGDGAPLRGFHVGSAPLLCLAA
jgi:hypothetical protein